jgi:hypothetical protein
MKEKRILLILNFIVCGLFSYCQTIINDKYEFPIKQGTEEWVQFETIEERIVALQVPNDVLIKITTEGLLENR